MSYVYAGIATTAAAFYAKMCYEGVKAMQGHPRKQFRDRVPCDEATQQKVNSLATEMGLSSVVETSRHFSTSGEAFGCDYSWSKPQVILPEKARPDEPFTIAHELAHIRLNHLLKGSCFGHTANVGYFWLLSRLARQGLKPRVIFLAFAVMSLARRTLSRVHSRRRERQADLLACKYLSSTSLVAAIEDFSFGQFLSRSSRNNREVGPFTRLRRLAKITPSGDYRFSTHPRDSERIQYLKEQLYARGSIPLKIHVQQARGRAPVVWVASLEINQDLRRVARELSLEDELMGLKTILVKLFRERAQIEVWGTGELPNYYTLPDQLAGKQLLEGGDLLEVVSQVFNSNMLLPASSSLRNSPEEKKSPETIASEINARLEAEGSPLAVDECFLLEDPSEEFPNLCLHSYRTKFESQ